jgi:proteic killer suppression protein
MIASFRYEGTELIWIGRFSKKMKLPTQLQSLARQKLRMIAASPVLETLKVPPNNRLEQLKGKRKGQWSIRINDPGLICFTWQGQLVKGTRSVTAETAVKLGKFFGVAPEFWMNLQSLYDIEEAQKQYKKDLKSIHTVDELKEAFA